MIPLDILAALIGFAFVTSITPGPNNMMLMASGVNFGLRRTVPHMLGVTLGHSFMVLLIGLGLGQLFARFPILFTLLKIVGTAYLLWLAWKIAHAGEIREGAARGAPMTFLQAAAFQWVNPKAWVMAVGAITTYTWPPSYLASVLVVAIVFAGVNFPSVGLWAAFGAAMRSRLGNPKIVRLFNWLMATLLVASLWPVFVDLIQWLHSSV